MSTNPTALLCASLAVIWAWTWIGRVLCLRTLPPALHKTVTPLTALGTGMGLWGLWFLLLNVLIGLPALAVTLSFFAVNLTAALALTNLFPSSPTANEAQKEAAEQFWLQAAIVTLLLTPVLWMAAHHVPSLWAEYRLFLPQLNHLLGTGTLPTLSQLSAGVPTPWAASPPVWSSLALPVSLIFGTVCAPFFGILSTVLLGYAAISGAHLLSVRIRWTNILPVAATTLLGVITLNPFFEAQTLFAALGSVAASAVFFGLAALLLSPHPLPTGLGGLPYGLIALFLLQVAPDSLPFMGLLFFFWSVRSLVEGHTQRFTLRVLDALTCGLLLVLLPLTGALIWMGYQHALQAPLTEEAHALSSLSLLFLTGETPASPSVFALGAALLVGTIGLVGVLRLLSTTQPTALLRAFFITQADLTLPFVLLLFYAGLLLSGVTGLGLPLLGLVLFFPLWQIAYALYAASALKQTTYQNPWMMGMLVALLFWGSLTLFRQTLTAQPPALLTQALQVGEFVRLTVPEAPAASATTPSPAPAPHTTDCLALAPLPQQPPLYGIFLADVTQSALGSSLRVKALSMPVPAASSRLPQVLSSALLLPSVKEAGCSMLWNPAAPTPKEALLRVTEEGSLAPML